MHKPHSNLNLCIISNPTLTLDQLESDLPMRIDIVDWSTLSEEFKKIIQNC